ncbi:MAG: hypothetical protein D6710_09345 [Nitrospirae bacterium]|nr:MAG: hypothetical protein D6710_09345 [Nitrospirota bacterium]
MIEKIGEKKSDAQQLKEKIEELEKKAKVKFDIVVLDKKTVKLDGKVYKLDSQGIKAIKDYVSVKIKKAKKELDKAKKDGK